MLAHQDGPLFPLWDGCISPISFYHNGGSQTSHTNVWLLFLYPFLERMMENEQKKPKWLWLCNEIER